MLGKKWWDIKATNRKRPIVNPAIFRRLSWMEEDFFPLKAERSIDTALGGKLIIEWTVSRNSDHTYLLIGNDITVLKAKQEEVKQTSLKLKQNVNQLTQSIEYARRLQASTFPDEKQLNNCFEESFVLYKPKDIVSGDYYFIDEVNDTLRLAVIDCTGHGVPGAMLSIMAASILREVCNANTKASPDYLLKEIDSKFNSVIANSDNGSVVYDGMEIGFIEYNKITNVLKFSGAMRSMLFIKDNEVIEILGSRYSIGYMEEGEKKFSLVELNLSKGDAVYLFTDGFHDQFGGERSKKLTKRRFKELLLSVNDLTMEEQGAYLEYALRNWKQEAEQTDDVLVVGMRV